MLRFAKILCIRRFGESLQDTWWGKVMGYVCKANVYEIESNIRFQSLIYIIQKSHRQHDYAESNNLVYIPNSIARVK